MKMSRNSLVDVMRELAHVGVTRDAISGARHARLQSMATTIPIPMPKDKVWSWVICHPGHLVTRLASESEALQALFASALERAPCSMDRPWSLVVLFDEYAPGNKLKLDNRRKDLNVANAQIPHHTQNLARMNAKHPLEEH